MIKATSDAIHKALTGGARRSNRTGAASPKRYQKVVEAELTYKAQVLGQALDSLESVEDSKLRDAHRAVEGAAQAVWRRRLAFHASDLVRFGRTYRWWRNSLVSSIEGDASCHNQLLALANPQAADDLATSAGTREVAFATVVSVEPLKLDVDSRRIGDEHRVVLLHLNGKPCVEGDSVVVDTTLKGSFKIDGLSIGPLDRHGMAASDPPNRLSWAPTETPSLQPGDRLIVADFAWFSSNLGNRYLNVTRPTPDEVSAPKATCTPESYEDAPRAHEFCCRPHEVSEARFSDELAARRSRGELNPQKWPPVVDGDAFEVEAVGAPVGDPNAVPPEPVPDALTIDDLE